MVASSNEHTFQPTHPRELSRRPGYQTEPGYRSSQIRLPQPHVPLPAATRPCQVDLQQGKRRQLVQQPRPGEPSSRIFIANAWVRELYFRWLQDQQVNDPIRSNSMSGRGPSRLEHRPYNEGAMCRSQNFPRISSSTFQTQRRG